MLDSDGRCTPRKTTASRYPHAHGGQESQPESRPDEVPESQPRVLRIGRRVCCNKKPSRKAGFLKTVQPRCATSSRHKLKSPRPEESASSRVALVIGPEQFADVHGQTLAHSAKSAP